MSENYTPDQPWFLVAEPPEFPERVTPHWVGSLIHYRGHRGIPEEGVLYIRSHMQPRQPKSDKPYWGAWRTFWRSLAFGDRRLVFELFEHWTTLAETRQADPGISDDESTALRRFLKDVESARDRLNRAKDEPMSWAGPEFAKYQPEQRTMLETLIGGIVLHRAGDISDDQLYEVLDVLDVDPGQRRDGISEGNLARILHAAVTGEPLEQAKGYKRS